jgi:histidinol-phosphate aminotransferase
MYPKPHASLSEITPYKGGESKVAGRARVIKLSSNETPLGCSPKAKEAYVKAAETLHLYPDGGAHKLRQAIGEVHGLDPERLIYGAGSDEIISLICQAYAGEGDEVLYTEHGFLMYEISARAVGATPVSVPEKDLTTDIDSLISGVTERTKIVFIANPNNPTGSYINKERLQELRQKLPSHVLLVIDGAYAEYVGEADYEDGVSIVDAAPNTIMTRTFSKIYGLAALRVGWAYAAEEIIDVLHRVRGPFNLSTAAIEAAAAAMEDQEFMQTAKAHNDQWASWLTQQLQDLGIVVYPSYGNFLLINLKDWCKQAQEVFQYLREEGVIVRPVHNYGLPDCLRITVGLEDENQEVVRLLTQLKEST